MASYGLLPYDVHMLHHDHDETSLDILKIRVWDLDFSSPIGLAAGLDKDAKAIDGLHMLGFGFVEVGTITPKPQEGNPKPRVFRLPFDRAIINRYGFNSEGLSAAVSRLTEQRQMLKKRQEEKMGSSWWGYVFFVICIYILAFSHSKNLSVLCIHSYSLQVLLSMLSLE